MIKTWKVAGLAVVAAVSIAAVTSPALAQNVWTGSGRYDYAASGAPIGRGTFGMFPRTADGGRYSPQLNGGGSAGYNWMIENDH